MPENKVGVFNQITREKIVDILGSFVIVVNPNLEVTDINQALLKNFGGNTRTITREQVVGHSLLEIINQQPWTEQLVEAVVQARQNPQPFTFQHPGINDPNTIWGWTISPVTADGDPSNIEGYVFYGTDITEKVKAQEMLESQSMEDKLTGLHNRRYLDILTLQLKHGRKPVGVVVIDVNDLKNVNDSRGHQVGDEFLVNFADILTKVFRYEELARVGGDEFEILMADKDLTDETIQNRIERLNDLIQQYNDNNPTQPTLAIGIGYHFISKDEFNQSGNTPSEKAVDNLKVIFAAKEAADKKMYADKKNKKLNDKHSDFSI